MDLFKYTLSKIRRHRDSPQINTAFSKNIYERYSLLNKEVLDSIRGFHLCKEVSTFRLDFLMYCSLTLLILLMDFKVLWKTSNS